LGQPKVIALSGADLNLVEAPLGGGTTLDIKGDKHLQHVRRPEIFWAEWRDGELQVILQSRLSPDAVAKVARAVVMRVRTWLAEELHGTLLGLLDGVGEMLGIGILQYIDFAYRRLEVLTAEGIEEIRGMHWGQTRLGSNSGLQHLISAAR
jgi:polynucleotide 5'-kinase involved in rRNA processing